jgi:MFS family permease
MSGRRTAAVALAVTLAIQVFTSLAGTATAVLAPAIARDAGVAPTLVGVFVGLVYCGAMAASLMSGRAIERLGPIRVSQICVLLCAGGLALVPLATGTAGAAAALVVGALVIGLGYGPITPASSQVLARTAPPERMALTFSIKQTGVPAGAALAGATLPALALSFGWRPALYAVVAIGLVIALAAEPSRVALDTAARDADAPRSRSGIVGPLRLVLADRTLRELAFVSFGYAATQVSLTSFLVVYLVDGLGHSLVAAGLALTVATIGGVVGRVVWGALADRLAAPRAVLAGLGVAAALAAFATAAFGADWPWPLVVAVGGAFGATAIGWNGVQLAELARHAPPGRAGTITGGAGVITFAGVVVGPPSFALLASIAGSYRVGFVAIGIVSLGCGLWLLWSGRERALTDLS